LPGALGLTVPYDAAADADKVIGRDGAGVFPVWGRRRTQAFERRNRIDDTPRNCPD
jgi:hypothetical protein